MGVSFAMPHFNPTLPARGMSVQMAAKAAQLNAIALPLKRGGDISGALICFIN